MISDIIQIAGLTVKLAKWIKNRNQNQETRNGSDIIIVNLARDAVTAVQNQFGEESIAAVIGEPHTISIEESDLLAMKAAKAIQQVSNQIGSSRIVLSCPLDVAALIGCYIGTGHIQFQILRWENNKYIAVPRSNQDFRKL